MNWQEKKGKLVFEKQYKNFAEAMKFVNAVADLAEKEQHHPDIHLEGWNTVKLVLYTHNENRITDKDRALAKNIETLAKKGL